jgi:perosamine synthetase
MIPYGKHSTNIADALKVAWQIKSSSLTQGSRVEEFERRLAQYVGAKYAVAVSSATAGLHIAVLALDLPENAEVITSPVSFVASSNSVLYAGRRPIFVDIDRNTLNLDLTLAQEKIESNEKIKAIIPVHFAGLPCDMESIYEFAKSRNVSIIEDAAHALGARYKNGIMVGSCAYSDMAVFSFHPVKSITSGEGGMITTNSVKLYRKLIRLRSHGINKLDDDFINDLYARTVARVNPWYYEMQELGYNYRLTDVQSVLGISQLKRIEKFMKKRRELRDLYHEKLEGNSYVSPAQQKDFGGSANHLFPVRIRFNEIRKSRNEIMSELKSRGVGTQVHYIPIPLHPYYETNGYDLHSLPESMSYYEEALTLPLYPKLRNQELDYVIDNLLELIQH